MAPPPQTGGVTLRYFKKRKTHPTDLVHFRFAVLGLGDSNLLLDRQTTSAKDCNQKSGTRDWPPEGGTRHGADGRTGLGEVEPWSQSFWASLVVYGVVVLVLS